MKNLKIIQVINNYLKSYYQYRAKKLSRTKLKYIKAQNFNKAAKYRKKERKYLEKIKKLNNFG